VGRRQKQKNYAGEPLKHNRGKTTPTKKRPRGPVSRGKNTKLPKHTESREGLQRREKRVCSPRGGINT